MNSHNIALAGISVSLLAGLGRAQQLRATLVGEGLQKPVMIAQPRGDDRLFVCERHTGRIEIIEDGVVLPTAFLDLGLLITTGVEQGLLGLAFHPDYAINRKLFVSYTNLLGRSVIRSYLADAADPYRADPLSFQIVWGPMIQPTEVHNGGSIQFGPAGMLYFGLGDGGFNDPDGAQNLAIPLGKMLRFNVDAPFPHIPSDNPYFGDPNAYDLIWCSGLRNPWGFGFDLLTGDLWISDVGSSEREEINFQPASSTGGENYGWACMEGTACTNYPHAACTCGSLVLPPVHEYVTHSNNTCAIIGGAVYRGQLMPSMYGRYLYTDLCNDFPLWSFAWNGTTVSDLTQHTIVVPGTNQAVTLSLDSQGEMYMVDQLAGRVWRLEEECQSLVQSYCITAPNSNGAGAVIGQTGSTSIFANDFTLTATGASTDQPGLFFYGLNQIQLPFGDGFRCVGSGGFGIYRLYPATPTDAAGDTERLLDFDALPASSGPGMIEAGDTWNFQFWYRDPAAGASGFNLSDALEVGFCP